jgi:hypothetical protein
VRWERQAYRNNKKPIKDMFLMVPQKAPEASSEADEGKTAPQRSPAYISSPEKKIIRLKVARADSVPPQ